MLRPRQIGRVAHFLRMYNSSQKLLKTRTPLEMSKRSKMDDGNPQVTISLENPLEEYKNLIHNMQEECEDDEQQQKTYKAIAAAARETVWKLLFEEGEQKKAADLLKEHKTDACFYVPWDYNDWIVQVRDEVLEREMFDFWHNNIVKNSLGPCWARDSDYFDDMDDPRPAEFYCHAGAQPPWNKSNKTTAAPTAGTENVASSTSEQSSAARNAIPPASLKISLVHPIQDYRNLVKTYLTESDTTDDDEIEANVKAIFECARQVIWSLLFDEPQPASEERQTKAGDLLKEHKMDASFHSPWDYNRWILKLRDEVLKRGLLDFWHNHIVKQALGPCWAKDSDYFDDMDDPAPAEFYRHAGAQAPWISADQSSTAATTDAPNNTSPATEQATATRNVISAADLKISMDNPLQDYRNIVKIYLTDSKTTDDDEIEANVKAIFECARNTIWALLFDEPQPASEERQTKAGDLLQEHKMDASFYSPWDYNSWIVTLRDELLKRDVLDFWRNRIVKQGLGPCWAKDSDYFDDIDDPEPAQFYKFAGCEAPWVKEDESD